MFSLPFFISLLYLSFCLVPFSLCYMGVEKELQWLGSIEEGEFQVELCARLKATDLNLEDAYLYLEKKVDLKIVLKHSFLVISGLRDVKNRIRHHVLTPGNRFPARSVQKHPFRRDFHVFLNFCERESQIRVQNLRPLIFLFISCFRKISRFGGRGFSFLFFPKHALAYWVLT